MDEFRHPQGFYIDQMKAYATTKIKEEDAGRVNCASFSSLNNVCKFIAMNDDIPVTKVYPSLRYIGYNNRYHDMMNGAPDMLYEMGDSVKQCVFTLNPYLIDFATEDINLFGNTTKSVYRIKADAIAVSMKDAERCGIKVSELNMYNVLEGLNVVMSNEPDYMLYLEDRIFKKTLAMFDEVKHNIHSKTEWMKAGIKSTK